MINVIFTFFDIERENWTPWKHRYACMEKNLAKTLFNCIVAIKNNIAFYVRGAKPPVDRITFHKLMVCSSRFFNTWTRDVGKRQRDILT